MENIVALSLICFFLENTVVTEVYRTSFPNWVFVQMLTSQNVRFCKKISFVKREKSVTWISLNEIIRSFLNLSHSWDHRITQVGRDFRKSPNLTSDRVSCEVRPGYMGLYPVWILDSSICWLWVPSENERGWRTLIISNNQETTKWLCTHFGCYLDHLTACPLD